MRANKKVPMIYERTDIECGAASLAMILAYYGKFAPYSLLCEDTIVVDKEHNTYTSAGNIYRAARNFDLECHGFRRTTEDLLETALPCVLHWNMNHFIVLERVDKNKFFVCDPHVGRRQLGWEEMCAGFSGAVLTFRPTERFLQD